jgi:hypothetical protein
MIEYYLRPDGAYLKIDRENKIITNVLFSGEHIFIGNNSNPAYVDNMILMLVNMTIITESEFLNAINQAKEFINNI